MFYENEYWLHLEVSFFDITQLKKIVKMPKKQFQITFFVDKLCKTLYTGLFKIYFFHLQNGIAFFKEK